MTFKNTLLLFLNELNKMLTIQTRHVVINVFFFLFLFGPSKTETNDMSAFFAGNDLELWIKLLLVEHKRAPMKFFQRKAI